MLNLTRPTLWETEFPCGRQTNLPVELNDTHLFISNDTSRFSLQWKATTFSSSFSLRKVIICPLIYRWGKRSLDRNCISFIQHLLHPRQVLSPWGCTFSCHLTAVRAGEPKTFSMNIPPSIKLPSLTGNKIHFGSCWDWRSRNLKFITIICYLFNNGAKGDAIIKRQPLPLLSLGNNYPWYNLPGIHP